VQGKALLRFFATVWRSQTRRSLPNSKNAKIDKQTNFIVENGVRTDRSLFLFRP